jgi:uncharacterized protein (TIGR00369 family)
MGVIHGGCIFTVMDYTTTVAAIAYEKDAKINVSSEINMSYMSAALAGSKIYLLNECTKAGKRLAFECKVYNDQNEILYRGHQTHAILEKVYLDPED